MRTDGWAWRARFGVLVIHNDSVPEAELWAMAPPGVTFHTARFESPRRPGADYVSDPALALAQSADVVKGLKYLGGMKLDAICVCWGSGSFFGGAAFDERFTAWAKEAAGGTPVLAAAVAMTKAMLSVGMRRPFVVMPPWFSAKVHSAAMSYLRELGFDPLGPMAFDLGEGWRDLEPHETYDRGGQWTVRPEEIHRQIRRAFPVGSADGVLIPGSGLRSLAAIESLEQDLGVPVIAANQACLWQCLQTAKVAVDVPDCGVLLRGNEQARGRRHVASAATASRSG